MTVIERDDLIGLIVGVLDREDPGGQPTIVATAIADVVLEHVAAETEQHRGAVKALKDLFDASRLAAEHGPNNMRLNGARRRAAEILNTLGQS